MASFHFCKCSAGFLRLFEIGYLVEINQWILAFTEIDNITCFSQAYFFSLYTFGTSLRFIVVQYKMYRAYSREKPFLTRKFCFIFLFYLLLLNYLDARLVWLPVYVQNIFATKASSTSIYSWRMTHRKANNIKNHATPPFQHIRPSSHVKRFSVFLSCVLVILVFIVLSHYLCHFATHFLY